MSLKQHSRWVVAEAAKKVAPIEFIRAEVAAMDLEDVQSLAVAYLYAQLKQSRRRQALEAERAAARERHRQHVAAFAAEANEREQRNAAAWAERMRKITGAGAPMPREHGFRSSEMDAWYANNKHDSEQMSVYEAFAEEYAAEQKAQQDRLWAPMRKYLDEMRDEWRMEWTRELLESKFSLRDGTRVAWGDATREQHLERMDIHKRNAVAGLEGYARHEQAVEELDRTGAPTLRDAVAVAA